jgi:hypothetical protein
LGVDLMEPLDNCRVVDATQSCARAPVVLHEFSVVEQPAGTASRASIGSRHDPAMSGRRPGVWWIGVSP